MTHEGDILHWHAYYHNCILWDVLWDRGYREVELCVFMSVHSSVRDVLMGDCVLPFAKSVWMEQVVDSNWNGHCNTCSSAKAKAA